MEDKKRTGHTDYRTTGLVIETLAKMTSPKVSFLDLTGKIVKRSREAYEEQQVKKEKAARAAQQSQSNRPSRSVPSR